MTGLLNARVLMGVGMIAVTGGILISSTGAFFSDTETSAANTFSAGTLDLKLDDSGTATTLTPIKVDSLMPGGTATANYDLSVSGDAWSQIALTAPTVTDGGIKNETNTDGDPIKNLHQELKYTVTLEEVGTSGNTVLATILNNEVLPAAGITFKTSDGASPFHLDKTRAYVLKVSYVLPSTTGNASQGDSMKFDLKIDAQQYQNNTTATSVVW